MVDFIAPISLATSAPLLVEDRVSNNENVQTIEEEPAVTRDIFEVKANEQQPKPLVRRNSYRDLCQSILGPDCPTCNDEAKLFQDLLHDNGVSSGF